MTAEKTDTNTQPEPISRNIAALGPTICLNFAFCASLEAPKRFQLPVSSFQGSTSEVRSLQGARGVKILTSSF
jgi:hypothetical protein